MDRTELTLMIAAALFGAVVLGWLMHTVCAWIVNSGGGPRNVRQTADLVKQLHHAEEGKEKAEARLAQIETSLTRRATEVESELSITLENLVRAQAEVDEIRDAYRNAISGNNIASQTD